MYKFLIADDHPMVRRVTRELLKENFDNCIILESETPEYAIEKAKSSPVDLILMDIYFKNSNLDGIMAIETILKDNPTYKVVIISNEDNITYIKRLQDGRARLEENFGYVLKNESEQSIIEAIKTVLSGDFYYSKSIFKRLINIDPISKEDFVEPIQNLSEGELDVVKKVAKGKTNEKIASELNISRRTVDARLCSIYSKLLVGEVKDGVIPRVEAVLKAKKYGLITDMDISLSEE